MTNIRINFVDPPTLPDGTCLGIRGEHNAVQLQITLPDSMVTDAAYHTITIGGLESARIFAGITNVDNAIRIGNVLRLPLSAYYTQRTSVDLYVTAYAQEGEAPIIVDKTMTLHGLWFEPSGNALPVPIGGLAAEFAALKTSIRSDIAGLSSAAHAHENKQVLDGFSVGNELKHNGRGFLREQIDDVQLLEQTTYDRLYFCTEHILPAIEGIPTELTDEHFVFSIESGSDHIQLSESNSPTTGLPERLLTVRVNGILYTYLDADDNNSPRGWQDANGDPCGAPEITNFTVDGLSLYDETAHAYVVCDDFDDLDAHARAALKLLSMIVHTSADRVDNPYFPEDTVFRFGGTIEPNRKYAFRATYDFTLSLPTVPWQAEDAQFVLYLTCLHNIDVTFPAGTLFIGGVPDTTQGVHKLIGTWNRNEGCWMIGSVTAEAAS